MEDVTISETIKKEDKRSEYNLSQWQLIWYNFKRHRAALVGGVVVLLFYLVALFAEFIAPYDPLHREMYSPLVPPMSIHIRDEEGRFHLPFIYGIKQKRDPETFSPFYVVEESKRYPIGFFVRGDTYKMWGLFESNLHLFGTVGEQRIHLLGTDNQGRDLFSRIIYGARISLSIGLIGVGISFILAIILGGISGYFGGIADITIQRIIEVLSSIPSLPLWMALAVIIPISWPIIKVFFAITVILSLMGWPGLAREVRGKFLSLRGEDYVMAAQLDNAGTGRLIFRYLLPSFLSHIIASGTLAIPGMILGETALSFLGIGLRAPAISWGVLLQGGQNIRAVALAPWLLSPVVFVVTVILAFNFLGDGLRDAADPYKV